MSSPSLKERGPVSAPALPRRTAILGAAALGVLAAGRASANPVRVEFWSPFTGPDGAAIDGLVRQFNETAGRAANTNVDILVIPWDQYYTKLSVAMASRRGPALAIVHAHRIAAFARQGALEVLTPAETSDLGLDAADYIPALFQAGLFNNRRYGVPIDAFPRHIYTNRALFRQAGLDPERPPQTLQDLQEAARRITALGQGTFGVYFRLSGAPAMRDFYSAYWQFNPELLGADGRDVAPGFEEAAVQALDIFRGFLQAGVAVPTDVVQYDRMFAQNRIGIAFSQITDLAQFQATPDLDFGVAPFPQFGPRRATFALGHNFVVLRGTAEAPRRAGLGFAKWISENGIAWARTGKIPARLSVMRSADFRALSAQSAVAIPDMIRFPPSIVQQPEVDRVVQEAVEAFHAGRTNSREAAAAMAAGIRRELGRR